MKTKILLPLFLLAAMLARGETNNLTILLQQGLFEEQANRNLDAAIADYQSLAAQFDKDRQLAATAIFRLGECYRAQNKTNEAAVQYQRVLRDFADQQTLSNLSRQNLTALGVEMKSPSSTPVAAAKILDEAGREIQRLHEDPVIPNKTF
jgi:tetratricopeptide (TPR) repeat protein